MAVHYNLFVVFATTSNAFGAQKLRTVVMLHAQVHGSRTQTKISKANGKRQLEIYF